MKNQFRLGLLAFSLITLLGCASAGPVKSIEFDSLIKAALPADAGSVIFSSPGLWYPNVQGFKDVSHFSIDRPKEPFPGIVVITEDGLYLEQWVKSKSAYFINVRIPFNEMKSISFEKFGLSRRFTIQKQDQGFHSFAMSKAKGNINDTAKTKEAYAIIQKRINS